MSFIAWWGLRAFTRATIGRNAVRLRRSSDNAELNWPSIAGGGLDTDAIREWGLTNKLSVVTLFDQAYTGSPDAAYDFGQSNWNGQPEFRLNGPGGRPAIVFSGEQALQIVGFITTPQPLYVNVVAKRTRVTGIQQVLLNFQDADVAYSGSSGQIYAAGGALNANASENYFHVITAQYDGSNSKFIVDGADAGVGSTTSYIQTGSVTLGCLRTGGFFFNGELVEASAFTTNASVNPIHFNQREYWGI